MIWGSNEGCNPRNLLWSLEDSGASLCIMLPSSDSAVEVWTAINQKGNLSMIDYISRVTSLADNLTVADTSLFDEEVTLYLLGGLGQESEALITSLTTQVSIISLADVQSMLLNHEVCLNKYSQLMAHGSWLILLLVMYLEETMVIVDDVNHKIVVVIDLEYNVRYATKMVIQPSIASDG